MKFMQPKDSKYVARVSNKEAAKLEAQGWKQVWPPQLKTAVAS